MTQEIWKTEKDERTRERVSLDGRWHLKSTEAAGKEPQFYLANYDVLCGPGALGNSLEDCLAKFIANCDDFTTRLAKLKAEAEDILASMQNKEESK